MIPASARCGMHVIGAGIWTELFSFETESFEFLDNDLLEDDQLSGHAKCSFSSAFCADEEL
jgi:hypothetical protein